MKEKRFFELLGFSVMVLTIAGLTAYATPTPLNGDFSSGLDYWQVNPPDGLGGPVSVVSGYAFFEEDTYYILSTIGQVFTIPDLALELSFDVVISSVPGGDDAPFAWPDAFTASLLDPVTFDPLISNPGVTEFYYLDNTGYEETAGTVSGSTVSLDVSSWAGYDVLLSFDLLGGLDGMQTTVGLDNVNVSVIPAPGALLLGLIGTGAVGLWRRLKRS